MYEGIVDETLLQLWKILVQSFVKLLDSTELGLHFCEIARWLLQIQFVVTSSVEII
jgi:hypothetical protein